MNRDQQEILNEIFLGKEDPDMAFKRKGDGIIDGRDIIQEQIRQLKHEHRWYYTSSRDRECIDCGLTEEMVTIQVWQDKKLRNNIGGK